MVRASTQDISIDTPGGWYSFWENYIKIVVYDSVTHMIHVNSLEEKSSHVKNDFFVLLSVGEKTSGATRVFSGKMLSSSPLTRQNVC